MTQTVWVVIAIAAVLVIGVVMGIGGLLLAPLLGVLVLIGVGVWMLKRRSEHRPPM